jgi:hypothetical protein
LIQDLGKIVLWLGIFLILLGGFIFVGEKINLFGHLPGDFIIKKKYSITIIPLASCLLFSLFLSGIFFVVRYFKK